RIAVGRVHYDDAALRRSRDIDVVDADPGAADDLQVFGPCDEAMRHFGCRPNGEPIILGDARLQLIRRQAGGQVDVDPARGENLGRARAQSIRNQYLRHSNSVSLSNSPERHGDHGETLNAYAIAQSLAAPHPPATRVALSPRSERAGVSGALGSPRLRA